MNHIAAYFSALFVFLALDVVWLKSVIKPLFDRNIGAMMLENPRMSLAGAFYAFYVVGILYFCAWPASNAESWRIAALNGAILGLIAYGTYEVTNMATLKNWSYGMLAFDLIGGITLTTLSAVAGYGAYRWFAQ